MARWFQNRKRECFLPNTYILQFWRHSLKVFLTWWCMTNRLFNPSLVMANIQHPSLQDAKQNILESAFQFIYTWSFQWWQQFLVCFSFGNSCLVKMNLYKLGWSNNMDENYWITESMECRPNIILSACLSSFHALISL